jgi:hypothetical protein
MDRNSIVHVKEIFTDTIFESGYRRNSEECDLFPIVRPDERINPIIIERLKLSTRNNKRLYWIIGFNLPSMDEEEVEREVIKDIIECLVWETIK